MMFLICTTKRECAGRITNVFSFSLGFGFVSKDSRSSDVPNGTKNSLAGKLRCFSLEYKAPAKRSQHFNTTYRSIVGCNTLRAFGHPVASCCDMLGVVGSNLTTVRFFMQHLGMLPDVVVVWPGSCNNVAPGHAHLFDFQLATSSFQMLGQQCWDVLR